MDAAPLAITLPADIYIGKITYDRNQVIDWAREGGRFLFRHTTERSAAWAALKEHGLKFSCDWVVRSDEIITCRDLRDEYRPVGTALAVGYFAFLYRCFRGRVSAEEGAGQY